MPADTLEPIKTARAALRAAEEALTNATARGGDRAAARRALDLARTELDQARRQIFGTNPGFDFVDAQYPLLLMPVRLETRYAQNPHRLLVRIYPDDIHSDDHEPALTREERELQKNFMLAIETDHQDQAWPAAWQALARRVGPLRALWLATGGSSVQRPSGWTRAAFAQLLPERFVAFAWTSPGGAPIRIEAPQAVREPLALGPDPMQDDAGPGQPLGADALWLHDFKAALVAGMGLEIPLPASERVSRLVVVGVRASVDPATQAADLARLIDAHRCTHGVSLLMPGEPTNALGEQRTAYRAQPDAEQIYLDELAYFDEGGRTRRRRASWEPAGPAQRFEGEETAGFRLDRALGLSPGTLGRLAGSDDVRAGEERLLRKLLDGVVRDGLERMLSPSVTADAIGEALSFMRNHVSACGPFATLRIGPQPYGVLPVRLPERTRLQPGQAALLDVLDRLRAHVLEPAVNDVLRVSAPRSLDPVMRDPGRRLLEILRCDAHARSLDVRAVLDPALLAAVLPAMAAGDRGAMDAAAQQIRALLGALGDPSPQATAIGKAGLFDQAAPVTLALVGDEAAVRQLYGLRRPEPTNVSPSLPRPLWTRELLDGSAGPQRPCTLLYELGRQAVLRTADRAARQWLTQDALDKGLPLPDFDDPSAALDTTEARLLAPAPSDPTNTIAALLDYGVRVVPAAEDFWDLREDLGKLAMLPPAHLEAMLGAVLGLLSHRLDAWYTGFATARLDELRVGAPSSGNAPPIKQGLAVGAFGWLDAFPAGSASRLAGYVHAPSTQQALTAAVLLSADKAHREQGHGNAFAVDLSSARVRGALELLEGLRAGQPLGALLGYRIERALAIAPALIAPVRAMAPLLADKRAPSGLPAENVAADNVVDGLALLRLAGYNGTNLPDPARLTALDAAGQTAIAPILADAAERIDALADLLLAESVHHTLAGAPMRGGAVSDLLAGGPVGIPDEIEVTRIGQRGIATTHKVLVLFEAEAAVASRWTATPRAGAEPALEAWLARQLPAPSSIAVIATFTLADGTTAPVTTTLSSLLGSVRVSGGLGAIDMVFSKPPRVERRIIAMLESFRPAGSTSAPTLLAEAKRSGHADDWSLAEVAAICETLLRLLGGARGLDPEDLDALGRAAGATLDDADLQKRIAALRAEVMASRDALAAAGNDTARRAALEALEQLGLDTIPSAGPLEAAVVSALHSLDRRIAEGDDASRPLVERMRSLGGPELVVVPRLTFNGASFNSAFSADIGAAPKEIRAFLARAAAVRDAVGRLDAVLAQAEALAGAAAPDLALAVAQNPRVQDERWTALPGPTAPARTSYVVAHPTTLDLAHARQCAGLYIDAWTEVVPQSELDTAIVFDAPAATQAAPNAMLLLVPEESRESWTDEDVLAHVLEGLTLAKLRAVDPDLLSHAGQLLPAMLLQDGDGAASLADLWTTPVSP